MFLSRGIEGPGLVAVEPGGAQGQHGLWRPLAPQGPRAIFMPGDDRHAAALGVEGDFPGPLALGRALGAVVLPGFVVRDGEPYRVIIEEPFVVDGNDGGDRDTGTPDGKVAAGLYAEPLQKVVHHLEEAMRHAPQEQQGALGKLVRYFQTGDLAASNGVEVVQQVLDGAKGATVVDFPTKVVAGTVNLRPAASKRVIPGPGV